MSGVQRYYNQPGAFWSPDPYKANSGGNGDPADPGSWNRYVYTQGDPVNYFDRYGLMISNAGSGNGDGSGNLGDGGGDDGSSGCDPSMRSCVLGGGGGAPPIEEQIVAQAKGLG